MTEFKNDIYNSISTAKLRAICDTVDKFAKENYPGFEYIIWELWTDSQYRDNDRIDILLLFRRIEGNVEKEAWTHKVFFINGELLTCQQYGDKYFKKEVV